MRHLLAILLAVVVVGCSFGTAPAPEPDQAPAAATAPADVDRVAVPRDGKRFDPPVPSTAIPHGAWYCDMGTVHYARMQKGDGSCPVCGMDLSHRGGTPEGDGP